MVINIAYCIRYKGIKAMYRTVVSPNTDLKLCKMQMYITVVSPITRTYSYANVGSRTEDLSQTEDLTY